MLRKTFAATVLLTLGMAPAGYSITITPNNDATTLVTNILGPGITLVGTPTIIGLSSQSGTFVSGTSEVGFAEGIVLSSGDVTTMAGPNTTGPETRTSGDSSDEDVNTPLGTSGDTDLSALAGFDTFDANVLDFSFQFGDGSIGGDLFFNFVFASEEYIDYVDSEFNDVFAFYLNGTNIALIGGDPITINTVNDVANSASYVNNVTNTNGLPVAGRAIKFDGLTTVLTASQLGLGPGVHTISLRIADGSDEALDSAVFLEAGAFSSEPIPEPGSVILVTTGLGLAWIVGRRYRRA
jgi:hypothetical protein